MRDGEGGPGGPSRTGAEAAVAARGRAGAGGDGAWVIETVVSPFHCLYQDALYFHSQAQLRLPRSEAEASRLARAAFVLYLAGAEALVHQAAAELARPELAHLLTDPARPLPPGEAWQLLPAIVGGVPGGGFDPESPPWPQFAEVLALRASWAYPGPPADRRAYYRATGPDSYEPLEPHQAPRGAGIAAGHLVYPRTGLPRDPYALRPRHLDTIRGVLDAAVEALDRRLGGALTRDGRHRREPVRVVAPPPSGP